MKRAFDRARDDRPLGVVDRGVVDDAMAQERPVLHQPKHGVSPWFLLMASERVARPTIRNRVGSAASATPPSAWRTRAPKVTGMPRPCNWRICGISLAAQPNRPRENRAMSWGVAPVVARSARISPITGANLKP